MFGVRTIGQTWVSATRVAFVWWMGGTGAQGRTGDSKPKLNEQNR